ncbi:hypothetical protein [Rubellimicrobium aerolatum]|uniref:Uncharacterized protein n=1 Tax=Rubellimicrobium aerolatum TaxID=490979 RepID=A0ABW0S9K5_9RHOB|nr:hypothetical protein [Rubellimicrobium aerolatum]MBP1804991.1 hypothetical protein [Rubellimicrobium aerolatum]
MIRWSLLLALWAQPSQAALVHFCWAGSSGYTMVGSMEFPDALAGAEVVTEADVTRFKIAGFKDGSPIGTWDATTRAPDDTWYLRYWPRLMQFPTNGEVPGPFDQGWNADGTAADCDEGEFGFNAGNYAQDFCLSGVWVEESGVEPQKPFIAQTTAPTDPECAGPALLSKRRLGR